MLKNFAPTGATAKPCPADHVTLHRGYLDSIVALLRDPTACRGPGLQQIVDDFESAIDAASAIDDTVLTAVADADEEAFWLDIDRQIYEGWSSVQAADVVKRLRLERLNLELLIAERDQNDPDQYLEERELNQLLIKEMKLKLLEGLKGLNTKPKVRTWTASFVDDLATPFMPTGLEELRADLNAEPIATEASPEAIAELKFAARDARRSRKML